MPIIYATGDGIAYSFPNGAMLALEAPGDFIIDRTSEDVARWKELHDKGWAAMTEDERTEWSGGMKGAYKHSDMNRVESAVVELAARFEERGTKLSLITKTDWTVTDRPTKNDMRRYFANVEALRTAVDVTLMAPATPSVDTAFDYQKANDLERILIAVRNWLDSASESGYYSGELHSGEV